MMTTYYLNKQKIALLFILFSISLFTQDKIKFDHLSIEEGLSQVTVKSIIQDSKGYMWFSTEDGVNRYDGYKFSVFKNDIDNPHSISNNNATSIFEDSNGLIWVGTIDGLNCFNPETEQFKRYFTNFGMEKNQRNSIREIYEDKNKLLWIGTYGKGLLRFNLKTNTKKRYFNDLKKENSLVHNDVTAICEDDSGNIWIGTTKGLDKFNPEKGVFLHYKVQMNNQYSLSNNRISSIIKDRRGQLLIGTWGGGLNILDPIKGIFKQFTGENNSKKINSKYSYLKWIYTIYENKKGEIWVGTGNGGLIKIISLKDGLFKQYKFESHNKYSISGESIRSITEDRSGNIWTGTSINGISILKKQKQQFKRFKIEYILNLGNSISGFFKEKDGTLWYGTKAALIRYDKNKPWKDRIKYFYYMPNNSASIGLVHGVVV